MERATRAGREPNPSAAHLQRRLCQRLQRRPLLQSRGKVASEGRAQPCSAPGGLPQAEERGSKSGTCGHSVRSIHLHPAVVVVDHCSHLRLLEHDLRHPHCREHAGVRAEVPTPPTPLTAWAAATLVLVPVTSTAAASIPPGPIPTCCPTGAPSGPRLALRLPRATRVGLGGSCGHVRGPSSLL